MRKRLDLHVKNCILLLSGVILLLFVAYKVKSDSVCCMGVPVVAEQELQKMMVQPVELDNIVLLDDYKTAYDIAGRKIYLSCSVDEQTKYYDIEGQLKSAMPSYDLYFLWEEGFENLQESIRYGCKFTLYAIDDQGNYSSYYVIFTTLPVLEMHGECTGIDERERELYAGKMTFWEPRSEKNGHLPVQQSGIEWHVRGYSSMSFLKKSLRLSLKEKNGEGENLSLAGLSADDDYILNPMWFDDVKVREKLAIDLWNEMTEKKNSSLKMSGGEYCEVIINGKYEGLRLLQNKIEKKYLKLDTDDLLLKGQNVNPSTGRKLEEAYEVIYAKDEQTAYNAMNSFFTETDFSSVNLENWIDTQLLILLGNMKDNLNYKNIYYVVEHKNGKETLSMIPWDTDMSFGVYWIDGSGFSYAPESAEIIEYRMEYDALKSQYPDLDERLAERWCELRETVFSAENILGKIDAYRYMVLMSGAVDRDFNILGWYSWGGQDTPEKLKEYIENRLQILDGILTAK